ncbi:hypothetical protein DOM22_10915 [Bdellovibrio sp. ZAP7]|uniref:hypothetical protein n=1 Tax=Bdellovibrio sp. ZAP7 TaxID=2231053 RepID=UPI001158643D|nr:hypothetical protein [Bdellovibrio sp. ZAP7]QDK45622.1 hypothetical protein DOM22_10915 [Bdellovibrio sp. ZAP7]
MGKILKCLVLVATSLFPIISLAVTANREALDDKILEKYVPEFLKKEPDTNSIQSLDDGIQVSTYNIKLDGNKTEYIVLQYFDRLDRCAFRVLKKERNTFSLTQETVQQYPTSLNGCFEVEQKDLDQDGKPELVVSTSFGREVGIPSILRWNGRQLVEITPVENKSGKLVKKFRQMTVSAKPIGKKLLIVDVDPNDKFAKKRIYLKEGDSIKLVGEYDMVSFIPVGSEVTFNPEFPLDGEYTLEANVLSNHDRAVRAQISVNGSKVLNSQDFCVGTQPDKKDKEKWAGRDDDDDADIDRCKRCKSKKDVYATVNLKQKNEIKVTVYGKKDSVVRVTLVKK